MRKNWKPIKETPFYNVGATKTNIWLYWSPEIDEFYYSTIKCQAMLMHPEKVLCYFIGEFD
jgi:hypothetical protein